MLDVIDEELGTLDEVDEYTVVAAAAVATAAGDGAFVHCTGTGGAAAAAALAFSTASFAAIAAASTGSSFITFSVVFFCESTPFVDEPSDEVGVSLDVEDIDCFSASLFFFDSSSSSSALVRLWAVRKDNGRASDVNP